jgi:predicted nucleotidyltransferase
MNIHFTDKDLFERLKNATIAKVVVGSHMYGTNNEHSDTDYLYIYATSQNELNSYVQTNHQLQYKEDGIDHNFVSLHTFIRNIINGDSTINFEVMQSNCFAGTELSWLIGHKHSFITYTIIRSYLGLARRDVKHYYKYNNDQDKKKRLGHIIRGYLYAYDMIYNRWNFNFKSCNKELISLIETLDVSKTSTLKLYDQLISKLRDDLNERFNNKKLGLGQHMDVDSGTFLNHDLLVYVDSESFKHKQDFLVDFNMYMFINSIENWVEY